MTLSTMIDPELVREMLALKHGQHLCLIYQEDPLEQVPALLPLISQGLDRNEQCIYIAGDATLQGLAESLTAYRGDVASHQERGALKLWRLHEWRQAGSPDSAGKAQGVRAIIDSALADGFSGVRLCVEINSILSPDVQAELRDWEATIDEVLSPTAPATIVCQYSRSRFAPAVIEAALSTHRVAIVGQEIHAIDGGNAPEILAQSQDCQAPDWALSQLRWARAYELERATRDRAEDALREAEISCERIQEQYSQADAHSQALERAIVAKDEFLGLVSHELRTPIATIIGNGLLLQKRSAVLGPEDREQALADIVSESQRLQHIIENLLMLTRTDHPVKPQLEPVSLAHRVEEIVEVFQRRTPTRDIKVDMASDTPIVMAESAFLTEVLENLLSNADKYSRKGAPIEVSVNKTSCNCAGVRVRDYGDGISQHELDKVFEPFYRSPQSMNKARGLGLGLAVCKRVVEAMGGSIWAVARPEGGSDFRFTLQPASSFVE